ncbi:MAG: CoA transferase [Proteobacteria bacterium]|nr:CoA transferase [Pseudomonadota bacterium]
MMAASPYNGLVVVEAISDEAADALVLAAGMAGRILADLGAKVIRIAGRDRGFDPALDIFLGAGKEHRTGADTRSIPRNVDAMIADAALVAQIGRANCPPLCAVLSMFGGTQFGAGPKASAFTISALGGLLAMVGEPDREPLKLGGQQEAFSLGLSVYSGLAAALAAKDQSQRTIQASLLETIIWLNWKALPLDAHTDALPSRAGREGEWQILRCKDGYAALVYQEPEWPRLKQALSDPRLEAEKFATRPSRLLHATELAEVIESCFQGMSRTQIQALAKYHRLPLGPVWSLEEALLDPHNLARDLFGPLKNAAPGAKAPKLPIGWTGGGIRHQTEENGNAIAD